MPSSKPSVWSSPEGQAVMADFLAGKLSKVDAAKKMHTSTRSLTQAVNWSNPERRKQHSANLRRLRDGEITPRPKTTRRDTSTVFALAKQAGDAIALKIKRLEEERNAARAGEKRALEKAARAEKDAAAIIRTWSRSALAKAGGRPGD